MFSNARLTKRNGYKIVWIFMLIWFYRTLSSQTAVVASQDSNSKEHSSSKAAYTPHSRRKRFLAFPLGSSFSTAVCMTTGVVGNPNYQYLSMGLNWGLAYDLPNASWILEHTHHGVFKASSGDNNTDMDTDKPDAMDMDTKAADAEAEKNIKMVQLPIIRRRERRDLYGKLEIIINSMGFNGRDCVLRALCESRQYFSRHKLSMIGEMLRVIFSLPKQRLFTRELRENSEIEVYDRAYRRARDLSCEKQYDCSFSLLELAFGKYSTPPPDYKY